LHFAASDTHVTLDVHSGGTHLTTSLKDLQKLGVDAVHTDFGIQTMSLELGTQSLSAGMKLPLFGDNDGNGILDSDERANLDVSLDVGNIFKENFPLPSIDGLQKSLQDAGIDHLVMKTSDIPSHAIDALSWIEKGVDITDPFYATSDHLKLTLDVNTNSNINDVIKSIDGGIDFLSDTQLSEGETWGSLIRTLYDAGLGQVNVEANANVHIADGLSSALYESGMLHALPSANFTIDVDANIKLLNTSLKAMGELGVDHINGGANDLYVRLGITGTAENPGAHLGEIKELFNIFGLQDSAAESKNIFAGKDVGLVIDHDTAHNLGLDAQAGENLASHIESSGLKVSEVEELFKQLNKLGITKVDVVGDDKVVHEFTTSVVAQTPVTHDVGVIGGTADDISNLFDPLHMHDKPIK